MIATVYQLMLLFPACLFSLPEQHEPPSPSIRWEQNFNEAFQKAQEKNLPVMILFMAAADPANEQILHLCSDPLIQELTRSLVCLVADPGSHQETKGEGDFNGHKVCVHHLTLSCEQHQAVEEAARIAFPAGEEGTVSMRHLYITPKGHVIIKGQKSPSPEAWSDTMLEAIHEVNPDEYEMVLKRLSRLRTVQFRKDIHHAASAPLRRAAIQKLVRTGDMEVFKSLYGESETDEIRIEFIRSVALPENEAAVPWLSMLLEAGQGDIQNHAAVSLEVIASADAVPVLLKFLERVKDEAIKKNIIRALGTCGPKDKKVQTTLKKYLDDRNPLLRGNAYLALHRMIGCEDIHRKVLNTGLKDKDRDVRACAAWAMGWLGTEEDIPTLMSIREKDRDRRLSNVVNGAIMKIHGRNTQAFERALNELGRDRIPRSGLSPFSGNKKESGVPERRDR